jgi:hypothetical protein
MNPQRIYLLVQLRRTEPLQHLRVMSRSLIIT